MLVELAVTNLGVIEEARIPFSPGMVALTGETGAGKTMLVEALNLLLGSKPDPSRVRAGATEAVVEGLFGVDDQEWALRRVVPAEGRSRAYIDGRLATAAALAELAPTLLELHGQHGQQSLLGSRTQRESLDAFTGVDRSSFDAARSTVAEVRRRLDETGGDERTRVRELDLLKFQLDEIDSAELVDGEEANLASEEDLLADAMMHRRAASEAVSFLGDDGAASDLVAMAIDSIEDREPFAEFAQRLRNLAAELSDCVSDIRGVGEGIEPDEARLETIRARRQKLIELRRKYGDSLADVITFANSSRTRLEELIAFDATRTRLTGELAVAEADLRLASKTLGDTRRKGAPALATAIEARLTELALPNARVHIEVGDSEALPGAGESVEIQIAVNPGSALGPLSKVASGGELSRVMLALRLVLSQGPPTMVFDEVGAGIGGETALDVGRSLSKLGRSRQVLVVTHLPQVAAFADEQILVTKSSDGETAMTTAKRLDDADRVVELSRMLSGSPDSATARDHAHELLLLAGSDKSRRATGEQVDR